MPTLSRRAALLAAEALRERVEAQHIAPVEAALASAGQAVADAFERSGDALLASLAAESARDLLLVAVARCMAGALVQQARATHALLAPGEAEDAAEGEASAKAAPDLQDLWQVAAEAYVRRYTLAACTSVLDTTRAAAAEVLRRGVAAGQSVPDIARALRAVWPEVSRRRAVTIVRTEVVAASNAGALAGAAATGLALRKEWIAARDARTRSTHRALDGVQVPMQVPFRVGGYAAMMPGDPALPASERVHCRCAVAFVSDEDEAGDPVLSAPVRSWRDERDARMRRDYPAMRAEHGQTGALAELADREGCSVSTVKRALWPK